MRTILVVFGAAQLASVSDRPCVFFVSRVFEYLFLVVQTKRMKFGEQWSTFRTAAPFGPKCFGCTAQYTVSIKCVWKYSEMYARSNLVHLAQQRGWGVLFGTQTTCAGLQLPCKVSQSQHRRSVHPRIDRATVEPQGGP